MTSPSPTHSDSSSSSKHEGNQVRVYGDLKLNDSILICDIIKAMFVLLTISFTILPVSPPPGQLGDCGGAQGLICHHAGA